MDETATSRPLEHISLSDLYAELNTRRVSACKSCDENIALHQRVETLIRDLAVARHDNRVLQDILQRQTAPRDVEPGSVTPEQAKVLAAAKRARIYNCHNGRGGIGSGHDFTLVEGKPCWELTCPVAQAEWERRVIEDGLRAS